MKSVPDFRQQYLQYNDINAYMDILQAKYPHLVRIKTIGYSFERRALKSIHISTSPVARANGSEPVMKKSKSTVNCIRTKSVGRFNGIHKQKTELVLNQNRVHRVLIDGGMHAREW